MNAQNWLLPGALGVFAVIGLVLLYSEVRKAAKRSKPVPVRIERKGKYLSMGRDARRPQRAAISRQGEAA
jgi:hypothetical protein